MSAQPTQASIVFPTPLGRSAAPARLEATPYEPRKSQDTYTYVTRLQPDVIPAGRPDGRDLHTYALFFPTQRDATGALVPGRNQDFMRDDTILSAAVDAEFPDGFGGKYRVDVNWRICWRMSGSTAFVRDVMKVEGPMLPPKTAAPTELTAALDRTPDGKPAEYPAFVTSKTFWQSANNVLISMGVTDAAERDRLIHAAFGMEGKSMKDYRGDENETQAVKRVREYGWAFTSGNVKPSAANAPETPAATPPANAAPSQVSSTTPPTENAPAGKSDGKSDRLPAPSPEPEKPIIRFPQITTLTGVPVGEISARLNKPLPPDAYSAIKFGVMSGKTDIDPERVRDRFEEVFGPMGIGWRITPHPTAGRVEHRTEERTTGKGEIQTWHVVTLVAHTLAYSVLMPDGSLVWADVSTTSDSSDNMDEGYAYRGALTSLMKQVYKLLGGMNHIMYGQYTHIQAQRDLARRAS